MQTLQFSMRKLLLGVLYAAVALAAVIYDQSWVGVVAVLGFLALVCLAIVGGIVRRGASQVYWLGCAVFGGAYFVMMSVFPHFLPTAPLAETLARLMRAPRVGDLVEAQWTSGNYYPARLIRYEQGQYLAAWTDGDTPLWVTQSQVRSRRQHTRFLTDAFLGPLFALAGAVLCRRVLVEPPGESAARRTDSAA